MPTDTNVNKLIINYLTLEQYQAISPNEGELYFVDNEVDALPGQGALDKGNALTANGDGTCKWSPFPSLDEEHEWGAAQAFPNVVTDRVQSKTTGNALVRISQEGDGYRIGLGDKARPVTIMGAGPRPNYATAGEALDAHAIAFVEDIPQAKHPHTVTITYAPGERTIAFAVHGESDSAEPIADAASLAQAFPNAKLPATGNMYESGSVVGTVLYVDTGTGDVGYWYEPTKKIVTISLGNMPGAEIKEVE